MTRKTKEDILHDCPSGATTKGWYKGTEVEAAMQAYADQEILSLQDENKRLRGALKQIEKSCDNTNDSHEQIWRIALAGLNPKEDENP